MTTQPQESPDLTEVRRLTAEATRIDKLRRIAVKQAKTDGAEITAIAAAASVTRPTVYRWLAETTDLTVDVGETLDDAIRQIAQVVSVHTADQMLRRVGHADLSVRIRGYDLGLRNLPTGLSDELRSVLMLSGVVVSKAKEVHAKTGRWPSTVTIG